MSMRITKPSQQGSEGKFSAALMLQCLEAMETKEIRLDSVEFLSQPRRDKRTRVDAGGVEPQGRPSKECPGTGQPRPSAGPSFRPGPALERESVRLFSCSTSRNGSTPFRWWVDRRREFGETFPLRQFP